MKGLKYCLFLDRDGTINEEKHYLKDPDELELIPGAAQAIREANHLGLKVVIVSNQSGIARGILTSEDVNRVNHRLVELLREEGAAVDEIYYCPHDATETNGCTCRKPNSGMFLQAQKEHNIDLKRSIMVGDRLSDMEAGKRLGMMTMLVLTGYGTITRQTWGKKPETIDIVVTSLYDSVSFIQKKVAEWKTNKKESESVS